MEHALPRRTAGIPRSWSLLLTSENHGAVGPLGSTFPHAGEKHERVQVVEIVAAGVPPAPGVDLAGLVRFDFSDLDGENEQFGEVAGGAYFLAHEVEARCASAAPVAAQADQVAAPKDDLQQVIAFLMGDAELEGVSFGERHPTKAGAFWWRLNLRAAMHKAAGARAA